MSVFLEKSKILAGEIFSSAHSLKSPVAIILAPPIVIPPIAIPEQRDKAANNNLNQNSQAQSQFLLKVKELGNKLAKMPAATWQSVKKNWVANNESILVHWLKFPVSNVVKNNPDGSTLIAYREVVGLDIWNNAQKQKQPVVQAISPRENWIRFALWLPLAPVYGVATLVTTVVEAVAWGIFGNLELAMSELVREANASVQYNRTFAASRPAAKAKQAGRHVLRAGAVLLAAVIGVPAKLVRLILQVVTSPVKTHSNAWRFQWTTPRESFHNGLAENPQDVRVNTEVQYAPTLSPKKWYNFAGVVTNAVAFLAVIAGSFGLASTLVAPQAVTSASSFFAALGEFMSGLYAMVVGSGLTFVGAATLAGAATAATVTHAIPHSQSVAEPRDFGNPSYDVDANADVKDMTLDQLHNEISNLSGDLLDLNQPLSLEIAKNKLNRALSVSQRLDNIDREIEAAMQDSTLPRPNTTIAHPQIAIVQMRATIQSKISSLLEHIADQRLYREQEQARQQQQPSVPHNSASGAAAATASNTHTVVTNALNTSAPTSSKRVPPSPPPRTSKPAPAVSNAADSVSDMVASTLVTSLLLDDDAAAPQQPRRRADSRGSQSSAASASRVGLNRAPSVPPVTGEVAVNEAEEAVTVNEAGAVVFPTAATLTRSSDV